MKNVAVKTWTDKERQAAERLLALALKEDLGSVGDLTSQSVIPAESQGRAVVVAREAGVLAGLPIVEMVFATLSSDLQVQLLVPDGAEVNPGDRLAEVGGPMRPLLTGERTALNFLQRLSGVATRTHHFVHQVAGTKVKILDTRKTTPGWRVLEKYAVRCGGGANHRQGLYDGVMIKDNHLAALAGAAEPIAEAVAAAREQFGATVPIEVEVDTLEQFAAALACSPDVILLDNMSTAEMQEAVRRRDSIAPKLLLEASGGVTLRRVAEIAAAGVDHISVGALTHSAPALDIALDYQFA